MALNIHLQLSNSENLLKIIYFEGLSHKIVIHPTIHGEPLLTAQPYYYLENLESVATIRYENNIQPLKDNELEYLVDNYLFEYSKLHTTSKISTKVTEFKFWLNNSNDYYFDYDQRNTRALVLDSLNDDAVKSIAPVDPNDNVDYSDWLIINNYLMPIFENYIDQVSSLLNKKVNVVFLPDDGRDGYIGKLRIVKPNSGLISYNQAHRLDHITARDINTDCNNIDIKQACDLSINSLPVERITAVKEHNPTLLSFYFSGLREFNPLASFIGYYNVLEYYFEEAPLQLSKSANTERKQLCCVIELLCNTNQLFSKLNNLSDNDKRSIESHIDTSSGVSIRELNIINNNDLINETTRWIYDIRCAIVHSKKTRNQQVTPVFQPYTDCIDNIKPALLIMQWLACLCIEKDYELSHPI